MNGIVLMEITFLGKLRCKIATNIISAWTVRLHRLRNINEFP